MKIIKSLGGEVGGAAAGFFFNIHVVFVLFF